MGFWSQTISPDHLVLKCWQWHMGESFFHTKKWFALCFALTWLWLLWIKIFTVVGLYNNATLSRVNFFISAAIFIWFFVNNIFILIYWIIFSNILFFPSVSSFFFLFSLPPWYFLELINNVPKRYYYWSPRHGSDENTN